MTATELIEREVRCEQALPFPEPLFPWYEHFNGQRAVRTSLLPSPIRTSTGLKLASLDDMHSWWISESGMIHLFKSLDFYASLHFDAEVRVATSLVSYFKDLVENLRTGRIVNDPKVGLRYSSQHG